MAKTVIPTKKPVPTDEIGYVKPKAIEQEMAESYLDYAMSVIVSRALPDIRDGLKPVHRRILYAMWTLGLRSNAKFRKSAAVVGEVIAKYHPHGDLPVYDALTRLAQDFAMRYMLVDGQGNFGSMDGDAPAAMRYTESRLTALAEEMLLDIDKDTVDFMDTYDATRKEPKVLPAKLPQLLINGSLGIAVGMATDIPPHNLGEVVDATVKLIDAPEATTEELLEHIKGPDFPTGGIIYDWNAIKNAYATGRGGIVVRAKTEIVEAKDGFQILITEIPYRVNKATLLEQIANLVRDKKVEGIKALRDESDREGVRVVVELKRDAVPAKLLNQLFLHTQLQETFHVHMLALVDGLEPRVLTLKHFIEEFLKHRQQVVRRRTQFELDRAKDRAHILEGLKKALDHIDAIIETIKKSETREIAHEQLMKKFKLSDRQAQAILEMKLATLAGLERKKINDELTEKRKLIAELDDLLAHPKKILGVVKQELLQIKEKYGDERRTELHKASLGEFRAEDLIPDEQVLVVVTRSGYVKRVPADTYRAQGRGGKGVIGMTTKEEDVVEWLIAAATHDDILFFSTGGKVYQTKVYELPQGSRTSRGQALVNFLQLGAGEQVSSVLTLAKKTSVKYLFMATRNGLVKKTAITDFANVRRSGLIAIKLKKGDALEFVRATTGSDEVLIATAGGQAIHCKEKDVRPMGRAAAGVRGIRLRKDDTVIGLHVVTQEAKPQSQVLVITENGMGKKSDLALYKVQHRGGSGIKTLKVTPKTGRITSVHIVDRSKEQDLVVISRTGQTIRTPLAKISTLGRATQGVRVMTLDTKDKVASATIV
jgi:DNA gyrase subunit A